MAPNIPKEIDYLSEYIYFLERLNPNDIDESTDTSNLITSIKKRIRGLNINQAIAQLRTDMIILDKWISAQTIPHPATFITAFIQDNKGFIKFINSHKIKQSAHGKFKYRKLEAQAPNGFELDSQKELLIFTRVNKQQMDCCISLQLITPQIDKSIENIQQSVQKKHIEFANIDCQYFELGPKECYLFTKKGHQFLISKDSLEPNGFVKEIELIFKSLQLKDK